MRTHKTCNRCKEHKEVDAFYGRTCRHVKKDGTVSNYKYLKPICKECWDKESRTWFRENWLAHLVHQAKNRAKQKGVPFDITEKDVTAVEVCPYLAIPLKQNLNQNGPSPNSPTLDRIIPEKGYVKGNVQLISHKANAMKHNATLDELVFFAEQVLKFHRKDDKESL